MATASISARRKYPVAKPYTGSSTEVTQPLKGIKRHLVNLGIATAVVVAIPFIGLTVVAIAQGPQRLQRIGDTGRTAFPKAGNRQLTTVAPGKKPPISILFETEQGEWNRSRYDRHLLVAIAVSPEIQDEDFSVKVTGPDGRTISSTMVPGRKLTGEGGPKKWGIQIEEPGDYTITVANKKTKERFEQTFTSETGGLSHLTKRVLGH